MIDIAIIGAGVAGLACARRLSGTGLKPVIYDKGRGIGGRVATRRSEGFQFDHGAQFASAQGKSFVSVLTSLVQAGSAASWEDGCGGVHIVGQPAMSSLARAMAEGLDIRQSAAVSRISQTGSGWALLVGDEMHHAARLVLTLPAPQIAALISADHDLVPAIGSVSYDSCLTLMAAIAVPAPFASRSDGDDALVWIACDSSKPGRPSSGAQAWVAQAGPHFSASHLELSPAEMSAQMLPMLCDRLGVVLDAVRFAAAHRWRYALPAVTLGQPFLKSDDGTLYLGGDWCLGPRIEAAWTSGTAIGSDLVGASHDV